MKRIYLSSPTIHDEERQFIQEAMDTNWVAPLGKNLDMLERELSAYIGMRYGAALSSGTAALHLAVKLARVRSGDVVFCSDLTFAATANPVCYEGARPVFIDSEYETWNMDPEALEKAFQQYPRCRVVILVHLYGVPAQIDRIQAVCDRYGAVLIEDAAESLSATYQGRQTGSFGKYSILSFNGNKIITTSGGGMLLSNDETAIAKAKFWSTQSRDPASHYQHSEVGYNYRMSNILAGIGRGQLLHLEEHRARKKQIYEFYQSTLAGLPLQMNPYMKNTRPNFWLSCILLDDNCGVKPIQILEGLEQALNAEVRPIWKPMHRQPVFSGCDFVSVNRDVSSDIYVRGLCLPSDIKSDREELGQIAQVIRGLFPV